MRLLLTILLIMYMTTGDAQTKWYHISGNDIATMSIEVVAGYGSGWRDEVLYHPNQLFRHFPNLPRKFWDNRIQRRPGFLHMEWNADHLLKAGVTMSHITAICLRFGEKKKFSRICVDVVKHYLAYQLGFLLSYNVTHHNKL